MDVLPRTLIYFVYNAIDLYIWIVVIGILLSWLVAFGIINTSNRVVHIIGDFVFRITEPPLKRIRNLLPDLGGVDASPVVLIMILMAIQYMLRLIESKIPVS